MLSAETKERIIEQIRQALPKEQFDSWFKSIDFVEEEEGIIDIPLPNIYYQEWYEKHYQGLINDIFGRVLGKPFQIKFHIPADTQSQLFDPSRQEGVRVSKTLAEPVKETKKPVSSKERYGFELNSSYAFDRFVVGPCNRLAHAASLAVAENPARAYNPLFIHGRVGLGKTHLLQAICQLVLEKNPSLNIYYLSSEGFVTDYINAMKTSTHESFRRKCRTVDILVIDDIHFLGGKGRESSQEEFFHTFNALHNAQKQIVLSSDSPPRDIPMIEERLVSRFKWGMVARLDSPGFETRVAILKKKAESFNITISDEIFSFIGTQIDTNIRDLEGAIVKVLGYADMTKQPINLELVKDALKDSLPIHVYPVTMTAIQEIVSQYFDIKIPDLQSKKRSKSISIPRQTGIYLARELTSLSLEEIGASFGGKDHTTVMYSIEKVKQRLHKDTPFKELVTSLITRLKQPPATGIR